MLLLLKQSIVVAVAIEVGGGYCLFVCLMVFNATFNNISVISWWSVLWLVEETGGPRENHRPVGSLWQTLQHNIVSSTPRHEGDSNSQFNSDRH